MKRWRNVYSTSMRMISEAGLRRWRRLLLIRESRQILSAPGSPRMSYCALCGPDVFFRSSQLQAHHIYPKALYPGIALYLSNGVMLCTSCHQGVVHNHNAALDIRNSDPSSGWRNFLVHFRRWNDLKEVEEFNLHRQSELDKYACPKFDKLGNKRKPLRR